MQSSRAKLISLMSLENVLKYFENVFFWVAVFPELWNIFSIVIS